MNSPLREAAARYKPWPNLYFYAMGKIALDPAYPAVVSLLRDSQRPLLDLGCGMGLLAAYLRANGHRAPILGFDVDEEKIGVAQRVLSGVRSPLSCRGRDEFSRSLRRCRDAGCPPLF